MPKFVEKINLSAEEDLFHKSSKNTFCWLEIHTCVCQGLCSEVKIGGRCG